jgi:hypothetical protein
MIGDPFNLSTIGSVRVEPNSFVRFLIASMPETLMSLFDDVVDVVIKGNLTRRKSDFVISTGRKYFSFSHEKGTFHLEKVRAF